MARREFTDVVSRVVGVLLSVALAVVGAWFWIWWLPNSLVEWIGGPVWLWVVLVVFVGVPAAEFIVGLVAFAFTMPASVVKAVRRGARRQRAPKPIGVVKYWAECYSVDRPGGFPIGPTLVEGEAADARNPAIAQGAKAIEKSLELRVPLEIEPGVGWHLMAEADDSRAPVALGLTGLIHRETARLLTVSLWPPNVSLEESSPPAHLIAALGEDQVRIVYTDEEPDRALLQLVAGSVAEYWRQIEETAHES